jgi:hypothetical protein
MKSCLPFLRLAVLVGSVSLAFVQQSFAWGHDAHSIINRLAGAGLPADTPAFLRSGAALDALYFYGPQPDHWRSEEQTVYASLLPEHDIDFELADLAGPLPRARYDFIQALTLAQAKHPDLKLGPQNVGLLPYSASETYVILKSAMRDYRAAVYANQDTRPVEAEILFLAGLLGHYVGDGSQPLHTTVNYNGWTTIPNPNNYANDHTLHSRFEGDYVHNNVKAEDVAPLVSSNAMVIQDVFPDFVSFLRHSNSLVEQLYSLDKTGAFTAAGTPEGKAFVEQCMAAGATKLRDMIYTAWVQSAVPIPTYKGN